MSYKSHNEFPCRLREAFNIASSRYQLVGMMACPLGTCTDKPGRPINRQFRQPKNGVAHHAMSRLANARFCVRGSMTRLATAVDCRQSCGRSCLGLARSFQPSPLVPELCRLGPSVLLAVTAPACALVSSDSMSLIRKVHQAFLDGWLPAAALALSLVAEAQRRRTPAQRGVPSIPDLVNPSPPHLPKIAG